MEYARVLAALEAFAVGDALGMPTEFMARREIERRFGLVDRLLDPSASPVHPGLPFASVTDDTEQVLRLLDRYLDRGIDAEGTAEALLEWIRETGAEEKRYVGPSSLKALRAIEAGADIAEAGKGGTTCGGIMRSPAAVLAALARAGPPRAAAPNAALGPAPGTASDGRPAPADLAAAILASCLPTHNTPAALEAAMAYGFALAKALEGAAPDGKGSVPAEAVIEAALEGAGRAPPVTWPQPSSAARIRLLASTAASRKSPEEAMAFLHDVLGTGLESWDVCGAVFGIFLFARDEPWLALRMGASVGGDTDTIAALAGALCAARLGRHGIPAAIVAKVKEANGLDLEAYARRIAGRAGAQ